MSESIIPTWGNGSLYVGLRDDPFFFDLVAFQDQVLGAGGSRTFCDGNENDFFAGANATAIVLELPSSYLTADSDIVNIWARTSDRTGMMVERKMELEEQIDRLKAEEKQERNAIEGLILQLSDPDERAVIRLRYFDRADWESTCGVLFGDRRDYVDRVDAYQNRTYKIHGRALLNLAAVLDELEPLPELRQ